MYTDKKALLISSILPDLTPLELQSLKEEIDSIIQTQSGEDTTEHMGEFIDLITLEASKSKVKANNNFILALRKSQLSENPLVSLIDYLSLEHREPEPVQESSRPLGIWKGQVKMSEDFYQTSSDILDEFGIEE
jgi:hypothetical protein